MIVVPAAASKGNDIPFELQKLLNLIVYQIPSYFNDTATNILARFYDLPNENNGISQSSQTS